MKYPIDICDVYYVLHITEKYGAFPGLPLAILVNPYLNKKINLTSVSMHLIALFVIRKYIRYHYPRVTRYTSPISWPNIKNILHDVMILIPQLSKIGCATTVYHMIAVSIIIVLFIENYSPYVIGVAIPLLLYCGIFGGFSCLLRKTNNSKNYDQGDVIDEMLDLNDAEMESNEKSILYTNLCAELTCDLIENVAYEEISKKIHEFFEKDLIKDDEDILKFMKNNNSYVDQLIMSHHPDKNDEVGEDAGFTVFRY